MTDQLRSKAEVWREAHAHRTECPVCHRFVTLRTLRWKHVCGDGKRPRRLLDECGASERFEQLEGIARGAHERRMRSRNGGGTAGGDGRAD